MQSYWNSNRARLWLQYDVTSLYTHLKVGCCVRWLNCLWLKNENTDITKLDCKMLIHDTLILVTNGAGDKSGEESEN